MYTIKFKKIFVDLYSLLSGNRDLLEKKIFDVWSK